MTDPATTTGPLPTMRDDQREASRRRVIEATLGILAEEGYRGLTVKKVGDRAGASRGMVNYHFESKAGLVGAVINDIRDVFVDRLRALPGYHRMTGASRPCWPFLMESLARGVLLQYQLDSSRARLEEVGRAAHDMVLLALTPDRRTG